MIAILLAAASAHAMTALEAERAFVADAMQHGQWTAFRRWATPDAVMFTPQPTNAQAWLKGRADPPVSVFWWPGRSYVSCDGTIAVNTGPWIREGGMRVGYFTTVWKRQPDGGWKWIYDGGDALEAPRAEGGDIKAQVANCTAKPSPFLSAHLKTAKWGGGGSADQTLVWDWMLRQDGSRRFYVVLWDGEHWRTVIDDRVAGE